MLTLYLEELPLGKIDCNASNVSVRDSNWKALQFDKSLQFTENCDASCFSFFFYDFWYFFSSQKYVFINGFSIKRNISCSSRYLHNVMKSSTNAFYSFLVHRYGSKGVRVAQQKYTQKIQDILSFDTRIQTNGDR